MPSDDLAAHMQARGAHDAHLQSFADGVRLNIRQARHDQRKRAERVGAPEGEPIALQIANGRLEMADGADPIDPNKTVRRPQARCNYDTLWLKGGLSHPEREAADRYARTCELADGARERQDGPSSSRSPWTITPPLTALQAAASLREVHRVMGPTATALMRLYVRDNKPAEDIAKDRRENDKHTMGRIKAALTRAAEHWGME